MRARLAMAIQFFFVMQNNVLSQCKKTISESESLGMIRQIEKIEGEGGKREKRRLSYHVSSRELTPGGSWGSS